MLDVVRLKSSGADPSVLDDIVDIGRLATHSARDQSTEPLGMVSVEQFDRAPARRRIAYSQRDVAVRSRHV